MKVLSGITIGAYRRRSALVALDAVLLSVVPLWMFFKLKHDEGRAFSALGVDKDRDDFLPIFPRRQDWNYIPNHCQMLKENPIPLERTKCGRTRTLDDFRCRDGSYQFFSQFKQDYILYTMHFRFLKRRGNYLDVAANDPIWISNTFFFDRCLGWSGLCVEAQQRYHEALHRQRSCALLPTCVTDRDGQTVTFLVSGGGSGIDTTHKSKEVWDKRNQTYGKTNLRCTTLGIELRRYGTSHIIDYMSLDVEGHELPILTGINWNITKINVVTIEVTPMTYEPINKFMKSIGYKELTKLPDGRMVQNVLARGEVIFLAPDVEFGNPK